MKRSKASPFPSAKSQAEVPMAAAKLRIPRQVLPSPWWHLGLSSSGLPPRKRQCPRGTGLSAARPSAFVTRGSAGVKIAPIINAKTTKYAKANSFLWVTNPIKVRKNQQGQLKSKPKYSQNYSETKVFCTVGISDMSPVLKVNPTRKSATIGRNTK